MAKDFTPQTERQILAWYWRMDSRKDIRKRIIGEIFRYSDIKNEYYVVCAPFNGWMS